MSPISPSSIVLHQYPHLMVIAMQHHCTQVICKPRLPYDVSLDTPICLTCDRIAAITAARATVGHFELWPRKKPSRTKAHTPSPQHFCKSFTLDSADYLARLHHRSQTLQLFLERDVCVPAGVCRIVLLHPEGRHIPVRPMHLRTPNHTCRTF